MASRFSERAAPLAAIAAAIGVCLPLTGAAADAPRRDRFAVEQERLGRVTGEIDRLRNRLASYRDHEGSLLDQIERIDVEAILVERELEDLQRRTAATRAAREQTRLAVGVARGRVEEEKRALAAWLRGLYTRGPVPYLALMLEARDPDQLLHAYRYASYLTETEAVRLERYRDALVELQEVEGRLREEELALEELERERIEAVRSLHRLQDRKRLELDRIRSESDLTERLVDDLSRTETDLRLLLDDLEGEEAPTVRAGPRFGRFHGLLTWPAEGEVAVPYGQRLHPRFRTVTPHPGVSLAVPPGRSIQAIFDGTVVFSDWFRGYGNMVILDHGGGYLSIYAHASRLLVGTGDEILQGDVIARTGDTGSLEGPRLYFEIRENGVPIDPLPWLLRPEAVDGIASGRQGS